jgi:hypothetical protein
MKLLGKGCVIRFFGSSHPSPILIILVLAAIYASTDIQKAQEL